MISQIEKTNYTLEQYLEFELNSEERHEYIDGVVIPMTGGTPNHNEIASNLMVKLKLDLRGKPYRCFISDQRLWIPEPRIYTYPDVMVVPRPLQLQEGRQDTVINPIMIAEVLSQSTKNYDKDEKFAAYRTIPTFQEYLLIDQYAQKVEHYYKADVNKWIFSEYQQPEDTVEFSSIPCVITLAELYEYIQF
jgi:Uma2 family endonuclease